MRDDRQGRHTRTRSTTRTPRQTSRDEPPLLLPVGDHALVRWTAFCTVTGRPMGLNQSTRPYFEIGDRDDLSYEQKLPDTATSPTNTSTSKGTEAFCYEHLPHLDEARFEYVGGRRLRPAARGHHAVDLPGSRAASTSPSTSAASSRPGAKTISRTEKVTIIEVGGRRAHRGSRRGCAGVEIHPRLHRRHNREKRRLRQKTCSLLFAPAGQRQTAPHVRPVARSALVSPCRRHDALATQQTKQLAR